jgi:hypothetical protein
MFKEILRDNLVCVLTSVGSTEDFPGTSSTSSNVSPSTIGPSIHFSLRISSVAAKNNIAQRAAAGRNRQNFRDSRDSWMKNHSMRGLARNQAHGAGLWASIR